MKTEDGGSDGILPSLPAAPVNGHQTSPIHVGSGPHLPPQKRTVCDHCRRRRIRCDGQLPCQPCVNASLVCKREHVPLKRGPKRGRGRVINELRERYPLDGTPVKHSPESSNDFTNPTTVPTTPNNYPLPPSDISWQNVSTDSRHAPEPGGMFSSEQFRPTTRSYLPLAPRCVELYYEHIYPIMPLPYMPTVRAMVARSPDLSDTTPSERNYLCALCALTCFHMSGQNVTADAPTPSWECAGRFFLDECIAARQSYDFFNDSSLHAVISSFWMSTSFFEINQSRKSWVYLREALTLAQDLGLHDNSTYTDLDPAEQLCRQRVFWQLFVTERSFAILRMKPITLKKTPSLPTTRHPYEAPEIHSGFLQLITSYVPLDEAFVTAWNEGSDPNVSIATYLNLQNLLAMPPQFLNHTRSQFPSVVHSLGTSTPLPSRPFQNDTEIITAPPSNSGSPGSQPAAAPADPTLDQDAEADHDTDVEPETTDIQKADLLITQQWLRLIVWQSSFRQQLLSWTAPDESMGFAFPLAIASRTASVLQNLPPQAIEVHGMGIFEKIFEIATWSMNVLHACDTGGAGTSIVPPGGMMGMDFAGATEIGVLGLGRRSFSIDPLEFFVRTLSASPNSKKQYADQLLQFASAHPGSMRLSLSPALTAPPSPEFVSSPRNWSRNGSIVGGPGMFGSVLGEVANDTESGDPLAQDLVAGSPGLYGADAQGAMTASAVGNQSGFGDELQTAVDFDLSRSVPTSPLGHDYSNASGVSLQNFS